MKTEITLGSPEIKPLYPRIMQLSANPNLLVLFLTTKCGTVVSPAGSWSVGVYYTEWNMSHFEEFTGKLTLSN